VSVVCDACGREREREREREIAYILFQTRAQLHVQAICEKGSKRSSRQRANSAETLQTPQNKKTSEGVFYLIKEHTFEVFEALTDLYEQRRVRAESVSIGPVHASVVEKRDCVCLCVCVCACVCVCVLHGICCVHIVCLSCAYRVRGTVCLQRCIVCVHIVYMSWHIMFASVCVGLYACVYTCT